MPSLRFFNHLTISEWYRIIWPPSACDTHPPHVAMTPIHPRPATPIHPLCLWHPSTLCACDTHQPSVPVTPIHLLCFDIHPPSVPVTPTYPPSVPVTPTYPSSVPMTPIHPPHPYHSRPAPTTPTCTVLLVAPVSAVVVAVALIHGEDALRRPQTLELIRLAHVRVAHCNKPIIGNRCIRTPKSKLSFT